MNIAKKPNGSAIYAGLVLLLCCFASAAPTYTFIKVAGPGALYVQAQDYRPSSEVLYINPGQLNRLRNSQSLASVNVDIELKAIQTDSEGEIATLKGKKNGWYALREGVISQKKERKSAEPGVIADLVLAGYRDGLDDLNDSSLQTRLRTTRVPHKKRQPFTDGTVIVPDVTEVARPVPIPAPGSIILAVIGAGLVKLIRDNRLNKV